MPIRYEMRKLRDNINPKDGKKPTLYPKVQPIGNATLDDLLRDINPSPVKKAEIEANVKMLTYAIANRLLNGENVTIDGLGTFSVVAQSRRVEDETEIRAESIKVKSISFRTSPRFLKLFAGAEFVRGLGIKRRKDAQQKHD